MGARSSAMRIIADASNITPNPFPRGKGNKKWKKRGGFTLSIDHVDRNFFSAGAFVVEVAFVEGWGFEARLYAVGESVALERHAHPVHVELSVPVLVVKDADGVVAGGNAGEEAFSAAVFNRRPCV